MFGLKQQIKLKQAKNALQDGRLDEAYEVASDKELREFRQAQVLLEKLVGPLLDRAAEHLEAGRLQEALVDVERALDAGGNRPEVMELRRKIRTATDDRKQYEIDARALIDSVKNHLDKGSIHAGRVRLEGSVEIGNASSLLREADNRERTATDARRRAALYLEQDEIEQALDALSEAVKAHAKAPELPELLLRSKKRAMTALFDALSGGNLRYVERLLERLRPLFGSHLELGGATDALALIRRAADAVKKENYEDARLAMGRAAKLLPDAPWVPEHLGELDTIVSAIRNLRTGPLGLLASGHGSPTAATRQTPEQTARIEGKPGPNDPAKWPGSRGRFLLWVDGIGTYLVLTSERATIGRAGSSARSDIPLTADIAGHHAQVLRVDEDYFIVAGGGSVFVNGKETKRHLLTNNNHITLGSETNCPLTFHLPTAMSTTAVLSLHGGHRIEADVRKVILLDHDLVLGPRGNCHVQVPVGPRPVVIRERDGTLYCRASEEINVDGVPAGPSAEADTSRALPVTQEVPIALGAHIQIGGLSFTITSADGKDA